MTHLGVRLMNYFRWIFGNMDRNNHVLIFEPILIANYLRASIPIITVILFVYHFVNNIIFKSIGTFYPSHYVYSIILKNDRENLEKLKIILKYFVLYCHLELLMELLKIIGLQSMLLEMGIIMVLLYMVVYQNLLLSSLYDKIMLYEKIIFNTCHKYLEKYKLFILQIIGNKLIYNK